MFWTLIQKRFQHKKSSVIWMMLSLFFCVFCLHTFFVLQRNVTVSYSHHINLTDIVVGAPGSSELLFKQGVMFQSIPKKTLSVSSLELSESHSVIPLTFGEFHRGLPIVSTSSDFFSRLSFASGQAFSSVFDVVLGAHAAKKLGYKLGDSLHVHHHHSHQHDHDDSFRVVGILDKSYTAIDNQLFMDTSSLQSLHPDKPVTPHFFWVKPSHPGMTFLLLQSLNRHPQLSAISPKLGQRSFIHAFKSVKALLVFSCINLCLVTFFHCFSLFSFSLRALGDEIRVLVLHGCSIWKVSLNICIEHVLIVLLASGLAVLFSSLHLSFFQTLYQDWTGFSLLIFRLPFMAYLVPVILLFSSLFIMALITIYYKQRKKTLVLL